MPCLDQRRVRPVVMPVVVGDGGQAESAQESGRMWTDSPAVHFTPSLVGAGSKTIQVPARPCCSTPGRDQSQTPCGKTACSRVHCSGVNGPRSRRAERLQLALHDVGRDPRLPPRAGTSSTDRSARKWSRGSRTCGCAMNVGDGSRVLQPSCRSAGLFCTTFSTAGCRAVRLDRRDPAIHREDHALQQRAGVAVQAEAVVLDHHHLVVGAAVRLQEPVAQRERVVADVDVAPATSSL